MTDTKARPNKVIVKEETFPVDTYNVDQEIVALGLIKSRIYEGEDVQRNFFINQSGKEYSMGPTTDRFEFIPHTAVLEPLLSEGYKIEKINSLRGGLSQMTILTPAEPRHWDDPIDWDYEFWADNDRSEDGLNESIVVQSSLLPGHGYKIDRGFFRLVCTNGMVAKVLDMGSVSANHANFNPKTLADALFGTTTVVDDRRLLGPYIGNENGVAHLCDQLIHMRDDGISEDLGFYVAADYTRILSQKGWWLDGFINHLDAFCHWSGNRPFYAMDLLNSITSPVSLREFETGNTNGSFRQLSKTEGLLESSARLIGALSLN